MFNFAIQIHQTLQATISIFGGNGRYNYNQLTEFTNITRGEI